MSMTSGPMLPSSTGNSSDLPSPYWSTAFFELVIASPEFGSAAALPRRRSWRDRRNRRGRSPDPTDRCHCTPAAFRTRAAARPRDRVHAGRGRPAGPDRSRAARAGSATPVSCARPLPWTLDRPLHHQFLDVADRARRVQPLRTGVDAVLDRVAAEQTVGVLEIVEAIARGLVAAVGDEPVSPQQPRRADELVRVPPISVARRRAAGAQDALPQPVQPIALLGRLQPRLLRRRVVVLEIRLDRVVLVEELRHVH